MNMHQRKKSRNGNRSDHGRPERGEKRQRPAREHVEREGVQEVVDFVFGRHAVVEALQTPDRVNRVFIQEGTSGRDAAKVIELAREKGAFKFKPFQRQRLKTLSAIPFTKG